MFNKYLSSLSKLVNTETFLKPFVTILIMGAVEPHIVCQIPQFFSLSLNWDQTTLHTELSYAFQYGYWPVLSLDALSVLKSHRTTESLGLEKKKDHPSAPCSLTASLSLTSTWFLNTSRNGVCVTFLSNLCHCLTAFPENFTRRQICFYKKHEIQVSQSMYYLILTSAQQIIPTTSRVNFTYILSMN